MCALALPLFSPLLSPTYYVDPLDPLSRSLAGATHSFAVLLSALFMGPPAMRPVQVGVRSKAQVHHNGAGPGLLGAAILRAISKGSERRTQSPEQSGGSHCLPKLLDVG